MGDSGGFQAAPPPIDGLGNFKGVMLCNRPTDLTSKVGGGGNEDGAAPFKSMISTTVGEQLGLPPIRNHEPTVKTRGPSAALRQHVKWLKDLQGQMRGEREQAEDDEKYNEERKKKMKAVFERQRDQVRKMMHERDSAAQAEAQNKTKKAPVAKPLWAMTEKEKDEFEEDEGDDLINFAENLDYDKFVGDLEFRQGMEALRDRAGKLKREQNAFKDSLVHDFNASAEADEDKSTSVGSPRNLEDGIDGHSVLGDLRSEYSAGSGKRSMGEARYAQGKQDWDSSTNAGDDRPQVDREMRSAAEIVLESAPQIRAVHSKESVQRIIEKAREKHASQEGPTDLIDHMYNNAERIPIPVIVASADTQTRLHKPTEPSQLPYLYRSPAI